MQKLYKVAFQRILTKIGADKLDTLNVQKLQALLKEKNIPLSEIDQTIFHKLPRQEVKNLVRNPCPIDKAELTSSQIVKNAKAVRGALNIVEKKICFKCPFVSTCDKAFIEPPTNFIIQNPLSNLLITMKNISEVETNDKIKNRSWFSGIRVCDSLSSVMDDLMQGGQQFKTFKTQRKILMVESESKKENQDEDDQKQLLKTVKKNKIPIKDVYAKIPKSKKTQNQTAKQGQQSFQQLSKGPQNIFKQKKSDEFIKIAKKYLNEQNVQVKADKGYAGKQRSQRRQPQQQQNSEQAQDRKQWKRPERSGQQRSFDNKRNYDRPQYNNRSAPRQQNRSFRQQGNQRGNYADRNQYRDKNQQPYRGRNENYRGKNENQTEQYRGRSENQQQQYRGRSQNQYNSKRQNFRNESDEQNPKIRRFSKDNKPSYTSQYQRDNTDGQGKSFRNNKMDKFYSEIKTPKTDQEQILSHLNKRQYKPRQSRGPRDAKFSDQGNQRENRRSRQFSDKDMQQFDRMEKIPKILKTQFASKQDVQQRVQQQQNEGSENEGVQRKGRRIKRV